MKNTLTVFATFCLLFLLVGCSQQLNDAKAEQLIRSRLTFPLKDGIVIQHGYMSVYPEDSLPRYYYILQNAGVFNIEPYGNAGSRFIVRPTAEGKKYIMEEVNPPILQGEGQYLYTTDFQTCTLNFKKIESIHEVPANNTAVINYVMERTKHTPFWDYYNDVSKEKPDSLQLSVSFEVMKTNNGWQPVK